MRMSLRATLATCAVVILLGCASEPDIALLQELGALQQELESTYKQQVGVNLTNEAYLNLTLADASVPAADTTGRRELAREVATSAIRRYPSAERLSTVSVAFQEVSSAGPMSIARGQGAYSWSVAELRGGVAPADGDSAVQ
jgi:hypothetical protein